MTMGTELMTIDDMQKLAQNIAHGGLFQAFKNVDHTMTLMMLCQAEGIHPIMALRRYDIIQGRPALKSDAMLADFQQRGGKVGWDVMSDTEVKATFEAPGLSKPVTVSWTIEQAKRAGIAGKDNWKNYPRAMLRARVVSEGIRAAMPGIVAGVYTPEEVQDFAMDPQPTQQSGQKVVDVEVAKPQEPAANQDQIKALCAAMNSIGVKDREDVLDWCAKVIGRKIGSRRDLTVSECSKCIDAAIEPPQDEPGRNG
jgi:hypothetical protein